MTNKHVPQETDPVPLTEWLNTDTHSFRESITVITDNDTLRLLRYTGNTDNPRITTVITGAHIGTFTHDLEPPEPPRYSVTLQGIETYHLHGEPANTLLTLLTTLNAEPNSPTLHWEYWEKSGRGMFADTDLDQELLIVGYSTHNNDRLKQSIAITNTYRNTVDMIAKHD